MVTLTRRVPEHSPYFHGRIRPGTSLGTSTPTHLNAPVRRGAEVSRPRSRIARYRSGGMLTASPSASPERLGLRDRLTPGRLASPGKPWSYGGGESRPPYRYLCLHLLFMTLQHPSQDTFNADMNAPLPLPPNAGIHGFGTQLIPDYYPRPAPRLVSCYALFE